MFESALSSDTFSVNTDTFSVHIIITLRNYRKEIRQRILQGMQKTADTTKQGKDLVSDIYTEGTVTFTMSGPVRPV